MKSAGNNEIDLLLRRLRGPEGEQPFDGGSPPEAGPHLDADELSAYAENALPAAARARYTEHVADCVRCRKLVTQLAMSAGVAVTAVEPVAGHSALSRFFANLFSPKVLRYAVPTVAAAAILVIGLMMFRYQSESRFVAQNEKIASSPADTVAPVSNTGPATAGAEFGRAKSSDGPIANDSVKSQSRTAPAQEQTKAATQPADKNAKVADEVRREDAAANKELQTGVVSENVTVTAAPAAPAAKPAEKASEPEEKREVAKMKREAEADQPVAASKDEDRKQKVDDVSVAQTPAKTQPAPAVGGRLQALSRDGQATTDGEKKRPGNAEVRSVAGRRFRKQGAVWVDTAFDSSKTPVNVARGSEQFRALVADEPDIRTIAEQLEGEIVVVWKSHVYRIR